VTYPFLVFDTEDDSKELLESGKSGFDKTVTQIAAITSDGAHYHNRGDVESFKQYLLRMAKEGYRYHYALNIQYDLGNLFGAELDELDCTLVGGRMIKAVWGPIIFVDVYNIWFQGVKSLGEVFGLKKLELDIHSREYVYRDCEIIREAMLYVWKFAFDLGLDNVPPTLGSLGVKLWRYWGGETVSDSSSICRKAIFGGRVELFKTHSESSSVAYTDLNSLYPFAMTKGFPGLLELTGRSPKSMGVVEATVQIPEREIMVLPWRSKEGKIFYGYGKLRGVWTCQELRAAEERGATILRVHNSLTTDEVIYPYKTYMERIYHIRIESKSPAERELYKRLMNTLFGRTGTSGEIGRTVYQSEKTKRNGVGVPYGSRVLVTYKMPLGDEVNWCHTAHITSYGRLELLKYMETIGAPKLIYCDTDSTIFDCPSRTIPFETGKTLGKMKVETYKALDGSTSDYWPLCLAWAPKQYKLAEQYKAKGVPKAKQVEFITTGRAEYDMPFKFREAVAFYDRGNLKRLSVWRKVCKENRAFYDKKILVGNRYFPCKVTDPNA
jgi:hypothetical protein